MSKRDGDTAVIDYKAKGYLPEAVVNFIALMGWAPTGEEEFFTLEELERIFSLDRVSKSPAVFDLNKLNYINAHYIKQSSPERLAELALPYLQEMGIMPQEELSEKEKTWLLSFVQAIVNHLSYMAQVKEYVHYFYGSEAPTPEGEALEILRGEQVPAVIELFKTKVQALETLTSDGTRTLLKQITKELKLGGKLVYMPIRIALTGQMHGPELYDIIPILGRENVFERLESSGKLFN